MMPYSSAELLAALPRLRRYARFLTDDAAFADQLVEEAVRRARETSCESTGFAPTVRLLGLLRSVHAERQAKTPPRTAPSVYSLRERPRAPATPSTPAASSVPEPTHLLARLFDLSLEQREVLVLVAVERLSYEDTAALLDVPVATVFARLVQARAALHSIASDSISVPESSR